MTETLTPEQIADAQAWALKVSKAKGSQYTPASKNAAAYILSVSPLTNEPVGVTTREEWEAAQEALARLEAHSHYSGLGALAGELAVTVRRVLNLLPAAKEPPLSASITGEKG